MISISSIRLFLNERDGQFFYRKKFRPSRKEKCDARDRICLLLRDIISFSLEHSFHLRWRTVSVHGELTTKKRAILALAFRSGCVPASLVYNKQKDVDFGAPAVQITQSALP